MMSLAARNDGAYVEPEVGSAVVNARPSSATPTRVLLVDDDNAVRNALRRVLEHRGYSVCSCSSGHEALQRLAAGGFDAMVSDVLMPGMSGLTLLRAIREQDLDLPVILVTGNPDVLSATQAVEYGAFQYLIKPVTSDRLDQVVARAASAGRSARLARGHAEEQASATFCVADRIGVSAAVERALGSLWLAYQPIFHAAQRSVFGYQALMRSNEPELTDPISVLEAAERVDRVQELGGSVRRLAALGLGELGDFPLFVKLHPEDLSDENLYESSAPLTLFATRIVLELTPRASFGGMRDARERILRLRALGFRIAIDDVGAGYAGLSSLTELEPEFVKMNMASIRDLDRHEMKRKTVNSLVELCHDAGQLVIAEGVQSTAERDVLCDLGCDLMQGYLLARPSRSLELGQPPCAQSQK